MERKEASVRKASSFPACLEDVDPKVLNGVLMRVLVGRSNLRVAEEAVRRIDILN